MTQTVVNHRALLRVPTFVGRSVSVPRVGRPDFAPLAARVILGGGIVGRAMPEVEEVEDAIDMARGDSTGGILSGSSIGSTLGVPGTSSPSVVSASSSSSGRGRCSATKVSLPALETPFCRHALRIFSRGLVTSHWSTYCHTRFRGVVPVGESSWVPSSTMDRVACSTEERWLLAALWYRSADLDKLFV